MTEIKNTEPFNEVSETAKANREQAGVDLAFNLQNWKNIIDNKQISESDLNELAWLHQYALENNINREQLGNALGYDKTVVFRILKGTYEGNWKNVIGEIVKYREVVLEQSKIQANAFRENSVSRLIWGALDYAMANNSITIITGESRSGKTAATRAWRDDHNHGRSVMMTVSAYSSPYMLMGKLCKVLGLGKNYSTPQMYESILRAFSKSRILIVDEAHRLLGSRASSQKSLEILRDIHDETGCALALLATQRFQSELVKGEYMFEQFIGRVGMPVRIPRKLDKNAYMPILTQYIARPSAKVLAECELIANTPGRLGILVETLKFASRIASKKNSVITEEHFFKSIAIRKQMMGEILFADKEEAA